MTAAQLSEAGGRSGDPNQTSFWCPLDFLTGEVPHLAPADSNRRSRSARLAGQRRVKWSLIATVRHTEGICDEKYRALVPRSVRSRISRSRPTSPGWPVHYCLFLGERCHSSELPLNIAPPNTLLLSAKPAFLPQRGHLTMSQGGATGGNSNILWRLTRSRYCGDRRNRAERPSFIRIAFD